MAYDALGQTPISPDQPAGSDARYEPEFEQLQSEIDKLSSPSAQGKVDWKRSAELSAAILSVKSKDLLVASYLSVALIHTRQTDGLLDGLSMLQGLLENFWEDLFPKKKRMRGRIAAIEWWLERTQAALDQGRFQPVPSKTVDAVREKLGLIDKRLAEVLPDPPLLRPLQKKIETLPVVREAPAETAADPEKQEKTDSSADRSASAAPTATVGMPQQASEPQSTKKVETAKDAVSEITKQLRRIRELSSNLLTFDLSNALAYRCRRIAAWTLLDTLPRAKEAITQFSAPPPNVVNDLNDAMNEGAWDRLVRLAEDSLPRYNLWMDLNRYSAEALMNLGEAYRSAFQTVCRETSAFCRRLPGIETLQFSDGTPFADDATITWLAQINGQGSRSPSASHDAPAPSASRPAAGDRIETYIRQADGLAKKRKIADAVKMIHNELTRCTAIKERHQWTFGMCRILLESKKTELALPYMDAILKDIETYKLAVWDPELAVKGLTLVLQGYKSLTDKTSKEKSEEILSRIVRLDPVEALRLSK